jgi:hypothetical protein
MRNCKATAKSTGKPCKQQAINGIDLCRVHGVNKELRAKAAKNVDRATALQYAQKLIAEDPELQRDPDPVLVLLETLRRERRILASWDLVVEGRIAAGEHVTHTTTHGERNRDPDVKESNDATNRVARIAKMCVDAGVSERRLALEQDREHRIAQAARAAVAEQALGLPPALQRQILTAFAQQMRQLDMIEVSTLNA